MFDFFKKKDKSEEVKEPTIEDKFEMMFSKDLKVNELTILIGEDIVEFAEKLGPQIMVLREKIFNNNGFIIPLVRIKDNKDLQENEYIIKIREKEVFVGFVIPNEEKILEEIIENLENVCNDYVEDIFSLSLTEKYLRTIEFTNKCLFCSIIDYYNLSSVKYILVNLLNNNQSIKDIAYIFEKMNEYAMINKIEKCFYCNYKKSADYVLEEIQKKTKIKLK